MGNIIVIFLKWILNNFFDTELDDIDINFNMGFDTLANHTCHAPHGACELKSCCAGVTPEKHSHAPHGACELKLSFHRYSRYNTKLRSPRSV